MDEEPVTSVAFQEWPIGVYEAEVDERFRSEYRAQFDDANDEVIGEVEEHLDLLAASFSDYQLTISEDRTFVFARFTSAESSSQRTDLAAGTWALSDSKLQLRVESPAPTEDVTSTGDEWPVLELDANEAEGTLRFLDDSDWPIGSPTFRRIR